MGSIYYYKLGAMASKGFKPQGVYLYCPFAYNTVKAKSSYVL